MLNRPAPSRFIRSPIVAPLFLFAATSIALGLVLSGILPSIFPIDDAYITARNAELLAAGIPDAAFNVSPLVGATSIPHLLLVSLISVWLSSNMALMCAALLALFFYAWAAWLISQRCPTALTRLLAFITFLSVGLTLDQIFNGLETGLSMACVAWILYCLDRDSIRHALAGSLLLGASVYVRPEILAWAVFLLPWLIYKFRSQRVAGVAAPIALPALFLAGLSPFGLWIFSRTGSWIPGTIAAKQAFFAEGCGAVAWKLQETLLHVTDFFALTAPLVIAMALRLRVPLVATIAGFCISFFAAYFVFFPGALGHYDGRYAYILVPPLVYCLVEGLVWLDRTTALHKFKQYLNGVAALILGLVLVQAHDASERARWVGDRGYQRTRESLMPTAQWANDHIPPGDRVLLHDVGYFWYATRGFRLVDLVGLKTPWATDVHRQLTLPTCGAYRPVSIGLIADHSDPQWAVIFTEWDRIFGIHDAIQNAGFILTERLRGEYTIYALTRSNPESTSHPK